MRLCVSCAVALAACGSVRDDPRQPLDAASDATASDGAADAPTTCTIHDTIDSCGPTCVACPPADPRQMPLCNGTTCDVACTNAAPKCTDNSCSRLTWAFDSNTLDGIQPLTPAGQTIAVRNHAGNLALAIDVTNLSQVSFRVPICVTGNIQLQTKTLMASVFFEGGTDPGDQYYTTASVPAPVNNAFLLTKSLPSGAYVTYSAPMSMSQFANTATDVVFQAGTFGAHFTGTIWFDDIRIQ
jgi:hypothetical protein